MPQVVTPPAQALASIVIPQGVAAGQLMQFQTPDGQTMQVVVPNGLGPGMQMQVGYTPRPITSGQVSYGYPVA